MGAMPDLMEDDEWPWYFEDQKCTKCTCNFTKIVSDTDKQKQLNHAHAMAISMGANYVKLGA